MALLVGTHRAWSSLPQAFNTSSEAKLSALLVCLLTSIFLVQRAYNIIAYPHRRPPHRRRSHRRTSLLVAVA